MFGKKYIEDLAGSEKAAFIFEKRLYAHIKERKGQFLRDESGGLHVIIGSQRIALTHDRNNHALASLLLDVCGVTTLSPGSQAAIQRLQIVAHKNASGLRLRRFSALSEDHERLYVPIQGGNLLKITAEGIEAVSNGENQDAFWLEHPYGSPLKYAERDSSPHLAEFERLLVDTQACAVPEMRWFVGMAEGLFPYVRDLCRARLLMVHLGPSQCGKTTGARRFVILHGLGDVKGDYSVASLGNQSDIGLLVLDNKEQSNFRQNLIDYCLFLATGGERGRSNADGVIRISGTRPIGVITTIEGIPRHELQKRCAIVDYAKQSTALKLGPIENAISKSRHEIGSALIAVLRRYMEIKNTAPDNSPNLIPEFEEHFTTLCQLFMAYADVSGKSREWTTEVIAAWSCTLSEREAEETDLEQPLLRVFRDPMLTGELRREPITHDGYSGTLYLTEMTDLLTLLQKLNLRELPLPKTASGLGHRLRSTRFQNISVLDEESAPDIDSLKRKTKLRPVGIFIPNDEVTAPPIAA